MGTPSPGQVAAEGAATLSIRPLEGVPILAVRALPCFSLVLKRAMRRMQVLLGLLLLAFVLPAAAGAASGACPQMWERLVYGGGAASGLYVIDAASGKPVCARAAKRSRSLASN